MRPLRQRFTPEIRRIEPITFSIAFVVQVLREAYGCADAAHAKRLLTNVVRRLRDEHPGAAASLEVGLDETLTVKRLGLPDQLARQLSRQR